MFLRVFLLLVVGYAASVLVGGWSPADVNSPQVVEAGNFAVNTQFPDLHPRFKITQARKQVVAGMNYDLTVEVTKANNKCEVNHFQVWNHFGTLSLTDHKVLKEPCTHSNV